MQEKAWEGGSRLWDARERLLKVVEALNFSAKMCDGPCGIAFMMVLFHRSAKVAGVGRGCGEWESHRGCQEELVWCQEGRESRRGGRSTGGRFSDRGEVGKSAGEEETW